MLSRSMRVAPLTFLVFLVVCFVLGYHFNKIPSPTDSLASIAENRKNISAPNAPRIGIATFVTEQRSYLHTSLKGKAHYARRHGYDLIVDYEAHSQRGTMWWKFEMITRLIRTNKYDWIWWIDFDTLITNTNIKLDNIIADNLANVSSPYEVDYLLTHDCNGLNMGSFIVRGHERSVKFFKDTAAIETREREKGNEMSEQDCMVKLLNDDPGTEHRTVQVPQWQLNAFPKEISCFDQYNKGWEREMFTLHFAGAWAYIEGEDPTGELMRKYQDEVIWGDWEDMYPPPVA